MQTDLTSGAHHGRTGRLYVWGPSRSKRKRRNRLDLCGSPPPVTPAQARLAVGRALEVMGRRWRQAGKNTDGRPGLAWDMALYVPLVVLLLVKNLNARDMESSLAENVVARVFIGRQDDPRPQIRDHSNIARAYAALGKEGMDEINALMLHVAKDFGFADVS